MSKTLIASLAGLAVGTGVGFAIGFFVTKNKCESKADKEIQAVRNAYEKHFAKKKEAEGIEPPAPKVNKPVIQGVEKPKDDTHEGKKVDYSKLYPTGSDKPEDPTIPEEVVIKSNKPRQKPKTNRFIILSPQDYSDSAFESVTLYYYADKVLADIDNNVIHDVNGTVGPEALSTFGRYLEDTVYVRDVDKSIDYEIIWDNRTYSQVNDKSGDRVPLPEEDN